MSKVLRNNLASLQKQILISFCTLIIIFISSGCTSLQFNNYSQAIRITTERPGAEIRQNGKLLGVTPAIISLERKISPRLELKYPGAPEKEIKVPTKLRWGESVASNLIFGVLAPIGWITDFFTGTAWDLKSLEKIKIPGNPTNSEPPKVKLIAIAPPQSDSRKKSDEVANLLQDRLTKPKVKPLGMIVNYQESFGVFEDFQYDNENRDIGEARFALANELKATHFLESELVESKDSVIVNYRLKDILNDQTTNTGEIIIPKNELSQNRSGFSEYLQDMGADLLPNTFTVDIGSHSSTLKVKDQESIHVRNEASDGWMGKASEFLGSFGLTNLRAPRGRKTFDYHVRLVPLLTFANNKKYIEGNTYQFSETDFKVFRTSVGIGPEIDLETAIGTFYINIVPGVAYNQIQWHSPVESGKINRGGMNLAIGLGYYRYFTNRFALRLFVKSIQEDSKSWDAAIDRSQGVDVPVESMSTGQGGVSLCFYFPEVRRSLR